jgi:hypothetical protein
MLANYFENKAIWGREFSIRRIDDRKSFAFIMYYVLYAIVAAATIELKSRKILVQQKKNKREHTLSNRQVIFILK